MAKVIKVKETPKAETEITVPVVETPEPGKKAENDQEESEASTTTPISLVEEKPVDIVDTFETTGKIFYTNPAEEKTMQEKIVDFLDSKEGDVRMNDFLKSLYPIPMMNQTSKALEQGSSKYLKMLLEQMQSEGKISIINNLHRRLGEHWYDHEGKAQRYNLNTMPIVAKK